VYAVSALGMRNPVVESRLAGETELRYVDEFPPAPPSGLVVLAETGSTRLVWEAGSARDLAGYLVFVSRDGAETTQLTPEPVQRPEFVHSGTQSGATYTYTVVAVDSSGNRSAPGDAVSARVP
jgi:chitodextrinase